MQNSALFVATGTLLMISFLGGCTAQVGSSLSVPPDSKEICTNYCSEIGMTLSAVAIMANNVGCVCKVNAESADSKEPTSEESGSVTGGMATIMLQAAAQQQQQQQAQASTTY
jgi:hypothetical protein